MSFGQRYTPQSPTQRYSDRMDRTAATMEAVRRAEKPSVSMEGGTRGARPKSEPYRDRALLDMARGRPCLLMVPGCCSHRTDTVVAAHSNWAEHGKSKGRKADDCYTAAACHSCHAWLDQGPAPAAQKRVQFMAAHALQVLAWRNIAAATDEPERFRRAGRWTI